MASKTYLPPPAYTQTPNVLFDYLLHDLGDAELRVLLYLVRRTFGFQRNSDHCSVAQICSGIVKSDGTRLDYGTGLSRSPVMRALASLEERGIVTRTKQSTEDSGSLPSEYVLRFEQGGGTASDTPPGTATDTPPGTATDTPRVPLATPTIESTSKESFTKESSISLPSLEQDTNLDQEDSTEVFLQNSARREIGLRIKSKSLDTEKLRMEESKVGIGEFRRAWLAFLPYYQGHKDDISAPVPYFLRSLDRWMAAAEPQGVIPATLGRESNPIQVEAPATAPGAPCAQVVINARQIPGLALRWNETVKDGPVVVAWGQASTRTLNERIAEPGFLEEFDRLLDLCQEAHAKNADKAAFVTFNWLIKDGNWTGVLNGALNWIGSAEKRSSAKSAVSELEERISKGQVDL